MVVTLRLKKKERKTLSTSQEKNIGVEKVMRMSVREVEVAKVMDVMEAKVKVVVEMSAGCGPHAPCCPGPCSDTSSSARVSCPSQSGSKVIEGRIVKTHH